MASLKAMVLFALIQQAAALPAGGQTVGWIVDGADDTSSCWHYDIFTGPLMPEPTTDDDGGVQRAARVWTSGGCGANVMWNGIDPMLVATTPQGNPPVSLKQVTVPVRPVKTGAPDCPSGSVPMLHTVPDSTGERLVACGFPVTEAEAEKLVGRGRYVGGVKGRV